MLSETELQLIDNELRDAVTPRSACVEALLVVQRSRGWVSDEAMEEVATRLGMPLVELESIATFYNLIFRQPVGKHVIHVCDGISCWVTGGPKVSERVQAVLGIRPGETTSDGKFTLLPADCMGVCDRAPAMIIDQTVYGPLSDTQVDEVINNLENDR
ncbi:MAG TPA: NADH-quinone oxidoreductase subunit NuoE [Spirochaetia bacterium]|nr:NADH-quinone oxidoreductase subunit NuoE [Spirochaetia bacterium]